MLSKEQIVDVILNAGLAVELDNVPTDKEFADLGLDSLDVFNIFVDLELLTGVKVPDDDIENLQTVDSIETYFNSKSV